VYEIFVNNIYLLSNFYGLRSSHGLCARAHAHSLEGTLAVIIKRLSVSKTCPHIFIFWRCRRRRGSVDWQDQLHINIYVYLPLNCFGQWAT